MSTPPPRLFFALVPDAPCLKFLEAQQAHLKRCGWQRYSRFSPPEAMHLTLRFLGSVSEEVWPLLVERVRESVRESRSFEYEVGKSILFPRVSRAKVVAAQVLPNFRLKQLARLLETAAVESGIPASEQPFRPHITLARLKSSAARPNLPSLGGQVTVTADRLVLFASSLTNEGPIYQELSSIGWAT